MDKYGEFTHSTDCTDTASDTLSLKSDQFQIPHLPQPHQKYYITQYEELGFS